FRDDAYLRSAEARIVAITPEGGIVLDRTPFYATSGGQPGDSGTLTDNANRLLTLSTAIHPDGDKTAIVHVPADGQALPAVGEAVRVEINWARRYRLMRMHTALHLLSVVFPFPVTGGQIGEDKGRLDFDMPEVPEDIAALEAELNAMVRAEHAVATEWVTDAQMAANAD